MGLTKKVLKRPVTTVLVVLCLIVFGLSSIFSSQLELIPEMEMPMLIVSAVYPGASPDDVDQLVISKIEERFPVSIPSPACLRKTSEWSWSSMTMTRISIKLTMT